MPHDPHIPTRRPRPDRVRRRDLGWCRVTGPMPRPFQPAPWIDDQAACAWVDPELHFPEVGASPRAAKAICGTCTLRPECLQWALDRDEPYGVWGGLTTSERRRMRKALGMLPLCHQCREREVRAAGANQCGPCISGRQERAVARREAS